MINRGKTTTKAKNAYIFENNWPEYNKVIYLPANQAATPFPATT